MPESTTFDAFQLARRQETLRGEATMAGFPRLAQSVLDPAARVRYEVVGQIDGEGHPGALMKLSARLPLRCERCNEPMLFRLEREVAFRFVGDEQELNALPIEDVDRELHLLGLVGLIDPPRPEARAAVAECLTAGIAPVMITGDHPSTALAIARALGIADEASDVITGSELERLDDPSLGERLRDARVFARVDPAQKIRIVEALQAGGACVAMTGDGVNDAPALKKSDIGVSMGRSGTDVAREASDLVLLDDNFATIVGAVREGRRIYDNIRKFVRFVMAGNAGEIWTIFLAPFLGLPIPLTPIQILWVNFITDGLPGLALASEPAEANVMRRPPRPRGESVFAHGIWQHILWAGLLIGGVSLAACAWAIEHGEHPQTMAFTVLTFAQLVHVEAIRSETQSLWRIGLASNRFMLVTVVASVTLHLAIVYVPTLQAVFGTEALSLQGLALATALSSIVFFGVEVEKWAVRKGWLYDLRAADAHAR